ncbi:MAG: flagellar cap protein FliD N-terminal domain-containing protein, partial [Desulfobacterales bacterium]|nr:flagellar cap protein FliD N-terminal domain-containing protein [Desulfobacterales bacterium]
MTLSTNLISGISSGFDWRSMIDQLIAIEHRPVDSVNKQISEYQSRLSQWQSFSTMLLSLNTASEVLGDPEKFNVYTSSMSTNSSTVSGNTLLSISTADTASPGTYAIKVETLAASQKLSSNSFSSQTEGLGSGYEGDIVINGKVLRISGADSLMDVAYN